MRAERFHAGPFKAVLTLLITQVLIGCVAPSDAAAPDLDRYRVRLETVRNRSLPQTSYVLDRNGALLAELIPEDEGYRTWIDLARMPRILRDAVVATEDATFFDNPGIDHRAVARAAIQNSNAGETVSGASTITMQLVRLVAFDPEERFEVSMDRKLREVYLAAEVDEHFSKSQILEAYLNAAFFGNRAYGVEEAARRYFGKGAADLGPGEATLLAGLVQAPSALNPIDNLEGAQARQRVVLERMVDAGFIESEEAETIAAEPVRFVEASEPSPRRAQHFVDHVVQRLPGLIGESAAARGGYTITTSLDLGLNTRLETIAAQHIDALRAAHDMNAASVVAIRPGTGEILAMVGDIDYGDPKDGQVNMATSPRQLGSTYKVVAYASALEAGWGPASLLWDVPLEFPLFDGSTYKPVNYDGRYNGPVRLRFALANSMNAAAIDLASVVGVRAIHQQSLDLGLPLDEDPSHYGLSIALGAGEVPLTSMVNAFATIAAAGQFVPESAILELWDRSSGERLHRHSPEPVPALSAETSWMLSDILSDSAARRQAFGARSPLELDRRAAVKTGTSNDFRDNATIGFTPEIALGVWTGNKDNRPMRNVLGITGAAPIWNEGMRAALSDAALMRQLTRDDLEEGWFRRPAAIVDRPVCELRSLTVQGSCRRYQESFDVGPGRSELGRAHGRVRLLRDGLGGLCSRWVGQDEPGRSYLVVERSGRSAEIIRRWASAKGIFVAPRLCASNG